MQRCPPTATPMTHQSQCRCPPPPLHPLLLPLGARTSAPSVLVHSCGLWPWRPPWWLQGSRVGWPAPCRQCAAQRMQAEPAGAASTDHSQASSPSEGPQQGPALAGAAAGSDGDGSEGEAWGAADAGSDEEWQEVARHEMIEEQMRGSCKVAEVEQCLAEGGHERVRVQLLLQSSGGRQEELDIQARAPLSPRCSWACVGGMLRLVHARPACIVVRVPNSRWPHDFTGVMGVWQRSLQKLLPLFSWKAFAKNEGIYQHKQHLNEATKPNWETLSRRLRAACIHGTTAWPPPECVRCVRAGPLQRPAHSTQHGRHPPVSMLLGGPGRPGMQRLWRIGNATEFQPLTTLQPLCSLVVLCCDARCAPSLWHGAVLPTSWTGCGWHI